MSPSMEVYRVNYNKHKWHITLCILNKWELSIYSTWILVLALQAVLKETQNISW